MSALRELQDAMAEAVLGRGLIPGLDETRLSAEVATAVYRNNVQVVSGNALRGVFPAVCALLGEDCFEGCAARYLAVHPSRSGDLNELGSALPAFLATVPEFATFPYLPDVARLEWLQREALTAGDAAAFDFARLGEVAEAEFGSLRFHPAPAVRMLRSAWSVYGIWRMARAGAEGEEGEAPAVSCGECVLVYRDREDCVCTERISAGAFRLLSALRDGESFAVAGDLAWELEQELDVGACLQRFVAAGVIDRWDGLGGDKEPCTLICN
jgi:hypothetical protein